MIDTYDLPFTEVDGSSMSLKMDIDITERKKAKKNIKLKLEELARSNKVLE